MDTAQGSLLVVDDNPMNRDMLARRLTRRGYTVTVAEDGYQALAMIEAQPFDLVLLDIMMPGISGLDVLKAIRQRYAVTDLPVIMATAKDQSEDIVAALQLGANDYVTKPLDFPVVLARTQTQLSLKRAMQEIQRLAAQLELRNRFIRETFGRYLTDEVVTSLLDSPEGLQLGGEKRRVTMLISDLRGFTSLSGRLAPEQVMAMLNRYLGTMVEIIMQYQGTIDEIIGDAMLVIFGAPIWRQDDAHRAVACAVAMQLAMAAVNAENRHAGLPDVEMGIGVHTGEVVVGNIGSHKRTKYGVVGSHVNLTFRIQSYTIGGQILISEATRQEVEPLVKISRQMEVEAKGIAEPIALYELRGIGGAYDLFLPEREEALVPLQQEVPLRYAVLEGEYVGRTVHQGSFVRLSSKAGEICSEHAVAPWSNLKMQLMSHNGEGIPGELYAKVLKHLPEGHPGFYVHFTSISPEVASFFQQLLGSYKPSES
jgi:adenylate cyclase